MARTPREKRTKTRPGTRSVTRPASRHRRKGAPRPFSRRLGDAARNFWAAALRWAALLLLCVLISAAGFAAGAYFGLMRVIPEVEEARNVATDPTYIYSAPIGGQNGSRRVIGTLFEGENREIARLDDMPAGLLDALVAKEDERFREHNGVDIWGILRALYVDVRAGAAVQGASTITQQYVRNAYLSQEHSLSRKLKEAAMAIKVERELGKNEILARYLNTVYFGSNAYGAAAAADTYFDKPVEDLTVAESATLVGLLWSPSTLGTDRNGATAQRDLVLQKMFDAGYITEQDYSRALEVSLPEPWPKNPLETGLRGPQVTRNFAEHVRRQLVGRYGAETVYRGGLSVYTTLDPEAQVAANAVLYGPEGYLALPDNPDAALISLEPETGGIQTMIGGRAQESFNLATQSQRQPGSSFKPFALVAALEQGIDPSTRYVSGEKVYELPDETGYVDVWEVENFDGAELGSITLEEALWQSDNSVFAELVMNTNGAGLAGGPEAVVDVARRLGVSSDFDREVHPSVVLGTEEVSPLDMATAYATIANGGRKVEPTAITKVVDNEGRRDEEVLYTAPETGGEQVIDPRVAAKTTEILVGDVERGIAYKAGLEDRPVAGKTGTSERFFDSWFVGYTPQLATAVWMGYAEGGATLEGLLNLGGDYVGPVEPPAVIWREYTKRALEGEPTEQFEGVNAARYDPPQPTSQPVPQPGMTPGGATSTPNAAIPGSQQP